MREGRASRTAEQNALFRALEWSLPPERRLFEDPFARVFLTWPLSFVDRLARLPGLRERIPRFIDWRWPGVRSSIVARTRLIDDTIEAALDGSIEQLVLLGAGFDSRAYRLAGLGDLVVFEVDHPDTQAAKRRALERARLAPPRNLRFVTTNFLEGDLERQMAAAGYREPAKTIILWEGVTNYLTNDAVDTTLRWCARTAPDSLVVFTYVHSDLFIRPDAFVGTRQLFASLERAGERMTFGMDPEEVPDVLARRGLRLVSDTGAAEYRARYYGDAAREMHGHEFYRVAVARTAAAGYGARSPT